MTDEPGRRPPALHSGSEPQPMQVVSHDAVRVANPELVSVSPLELRGHAQGPATVHLNQLPPNVGQGADQGSETLQQSLSGVLGAFWRYRWAAMLAAVFGFAPFVAYFFTAIPEYTASGLVQVGARDAFGASNPLSEIMGAGDSAVLNEVEIMRRRGLILDVAKQLKLHVVDPDEPKRFTLDTRVSRGGKSITSPGLRAVRHAITRAELAGAQALAHAGAGVHLAVRNHETSGGLVLRQVDGEGRPITQDFHVQIGRPFETTTYVVQFSGQLTGFPANEWVKFAIRHDTEVVISIRKHLDLSPIKEGMWLTNLIRAQFTHHDREVAQAYVNGLMESYVRQSQAWKSASASTAATFIAEQLERVQGELRSSENELRNYSTKQRAVQLPMQADQTIVAVGDIESELMAVEVQARVLRDVVRRVESAGNEGRANLTTNFVNDPVLAQSIAKLTEEESQLNVLRATLKPSHPKVQDAHAKLVRRRQSVVELMRSSEANLRNRAKRLKSRRNNLAGSLRRYPDKQLELARRRRDVEVNERLAAFLLEKQQDAEIVKAATTTDKRIVDPAALPLYRSRPVSAQIAIVGFIFASACALAVVILLSLTRRRLHTVEDIRSQVWYQDMGVIPESSKLRRDKDVRALATRHMASAQEFGDPAVQEALRSLGSTIELQRRPEGGREQVIAVTSSVLGEGKTTISAHLALSLARLGARVFIIDLDLRRPSQHRRWSVESAPGYFDLMMSQDRVGMFPHCVRRLGQMGIDLMPAGSRAGDATQVLTSSMVQGLVSSLRNGYDYIILDAPPAFVADTSVIASAADLVLLVARAGLVKKSEIKGAMATLERCSARKALIVNSVKSSGSAGVYGQGLGYR